MKRKPNLLRRFTGLDVRRDAADSDPLTLRTATNVSLTTAGSLVRRDALVNVCPLHAQSVGLYSANGMLRCVVPGGVGYQDLRPANVMYDPIGAGSDFGDNLIDRLLGVELIGGSDSPAAFPYVALLMTDGTIQHHWLNAAPALSTDAVNTRVVLPFEPGYTLTKIANKMWCDDPSNGVLRGSSSVNGPTDWNAPRDACTLAVQQHAGGTGALKALSFFQDKLAVFFGSALQLWTVDPDPSLNTLYKAYSGPGTDAPGSVANVRGDSYFFSRGGFRSLALAVTAFLSQPREGDIGAPIQPLTDDIDASVTPAISLWSQARSQYLCAFGSTVYCFTSSVTEKLNGWTTWELPVEVENMVEHEGQLYIRSNDTLYRFDPTVVLDGVGDGSVTFDVKTQYVDAEAPGITKRWRALDVVQAGTCRLDFYSQPRDTAAVSTGPNLTGTSYDQGIIPVGEWSENLSIGFTGTGLWQLDAILLHYDILNRGAM